MNIMLGHAKQIVLSNLHNIHKLPNTFDLTYICLEEKLVILCRTYFQKLDLILSYSSHYFPNYNSPLYSLVSTRVSNKTRQCNFSDKGAMGQAQNLEKGRDAPGSLSKSGTRHGTGRDFDSLSCPAGQNRTGQKITF